MGETKIIIKNCNCIKEAEVIIKENTLNIKYGLNGTGKSTIGKAIAAQGNGNEDELNFLKPYSKDRLPSVENLPSKTTKIFDEKYVNSYIFKENSFLKNSYQVFLHSDECENLSRKIDDLLMELQGKFQSSQDLKELKEFIPKYFETIKITNGKIYKRGGIGELLKGNGSGFEKYEILNPYKSFYQREIPLVSKWAKWRKDGIDHINGNLCPFCTGKMNLPRINNENTLISKVFKNSALSTANAVLEFLNEGVEKKYIHDISIQAIKNYMGDETKENELYSELHDLAIETAYLEAKIENICQFKPMNVTREQLTQIEKNLDDMVIEDRRIKKFYSTAFMKKISQEINQKVEKLKQNTGKLKGLFIQYQTKMDDLIMKRGEDINEFLSLAGFPYKFILKGDGNERAMSYLVPLHVSENIIVENLDNHLSWGEKNAFAIVMFMFQAISENIELIILDDPITSFDNDKKFAVVRRLFDNKKESFKEKTVLLLTHDMQPLIDFVLLGMFGRFGLTTSVNAQYLYNKMGVIEEKQITKSNFLNVLTLTQKFYEDINQNMAVRIINLRKYIELSESNFLEKPLYEILSNIIHGRVKPQDKDGNDLNELIKIKGENELKKYIIDKSYEQIIDELTEKKLLKMLENTNNYQKTIIIRLLFERHEDEGIMTKLRRKYPGACKFVNATNHIENDYVYQLDPLEFFEIPEIFINQLEEFLNNDLNFKDVNI